MMSVFVRLLDAADKSSSLQHACAAYKRDGQSTNVFIGDVQRFNDVPGSPFCYWAGAEILAAFQKHRALESPQFSARVGLQTSDDFRFLRNCWEVLSQGGRWYGFAKGGAFSPYYADINLLIGWSEDGREMKAWAESLYGGGQHWSRRLQNVQYGFRPGVTWPQRTQVGLGARVMPTNCLFGVKGPAIFHADNNVGDLLALLGVMQSRQFAQLVELQMAFGSYDVGVIQRTPVPPMPSVITDQLSEMVRSAWSLKRSLDSIEETSHAFLLPATLRVRHGGHDSDAIGLELARIQSDIDAVVFGLYGLSDIKLQSLREQVDCERAAENKAPDDDIEEEAETEAPPVDALLSWAVGVAFGRFDWRLATGEREAPPEPAPFDALPAMSPGMLKPDAESFHAHSGILVDDQGHQHDLSRLVEEVLARVDAPAPVDVRAWLKRDFFAFHLQRYTKSRRKAPIYWPLSTPSGSYTLWLYYPRLSNQTLYSAINDFLDGPNGKLLQVAGDVAALRNKGAARTRDEERRFEGLEAFELELMELRDTLLKIAPTFKPNQDDGVQITAAPLWPLFRHKPWQKILKDTWAKLEKGDYDWAHLAMNYWPDRVRGKCKADKSLTIAHGLEHLYVEPETMPKRTRGRKNAGDAE